MRYVFLFLLTLIISEQSIANDHKLRAYLDSKQFYAPGQGNYVEFQLQFVGASVNYKGKENGLVGELAIHMTVTKYDSVIASDAYRLATPFMRDSIVSDFYDLKRFLLEPGEYTFTIELRDLNSEHEPVKTSQNILVEDFSNSISISDLQIAEYANQGDGSSIFFKSGYDIIPRLATFYPEELTTIPVYLEVYNTTKLSEPVFAIKQMVMNALTNEEVTSLTQFKKLQAAEVVPYLNQVDITELPTGKYILSYTLLNKNMIELATQSYEFDRDKVVAMDYFADELILDPAFQASITDDSIGFFLESLIPISQSNEVKNIIRLSKARDADRARKYIQLYWLRTSPKKTTENWLKYKVQVVAVERFFANSFKNGYETDRGRVYLKYGPPTEINKNENSSVEYPYEIWQFNRIGAFNNKRFIFYNPDMANNTYQLLHSDMIGEIKNLNWPQALSSRSGQTKNQFGGNSRDLFNE